jgi:hypothetical protein
LRLRNGSMIPLDHMSDEALHYLNVEAVARGLSNSMLASLIVKTVCEDKLMIALFDDATALELKPPRRIHRRHRSSESA